MTKTSNPFLFILRNVAALTLLSSAVVYGLWKLGFEPRVEQKIEPLYYMVLENNLIVKKTTSVEILEEVRKTIECIKNSRENN